MWPQTITFEFPAPTKGAGADIKAWGDAIGLPWIGIGGTLRTSYYTNTWPNSDETEVGDWLPNLTLTELPTSGAYPTTKRQAAIYLRVVPSTLPEGHEVYFRNDNIFSGTPGVL